MISVPPVLRAPRISGWSVDGSGLREHCRSADAVRLQIADGTPAPAPLATSVAAAWDTDALFIGFEASFLSLRTAPVSVPPEPGSGKTLRLWEQSDVLEMFIGVDVPETGRYREFEIAPDGRWIDIDVDHSAEPLRADFAWRSGAQFHSVVDHDAHRWFAALRIPWRALTDADPREVSWWCNGYRATGRFHGDELFAWSPTGLGPGCFHRFNHFGRLELR